MNPVDHPHGGGEEGPLEVETLCSRVFRLREKEQEIIKEQINLF